MTTDEHAYDEQVEEQEERDHARPAPSAARHGETPRLRLHSTVVYDTIRRDGEEELRRPLTSLWWSGVGAGLAISSSVVAEGVLHSHLPQADWTVLISSFGYCVGFLIVVLGRLQLFTENTITAILPLLADTTRLRTLQTARLWGVVFLANLVGTAAAAGVSAALGIATDEQLRALIEVSLPLADKTAMETLLSGIPAGFLIAAMVWMLPSSQNFEFWVILVITYVIGIGGFSHVIAGSTEAFLLIFQSRLSVAEGLFGFLLPCLAGNVIGGTLLFALLAYGQVKEEI
jgi:formate/nitrite transporter FocA (FNT family)